MAQASGWLLIARNRFAKMPFLATVKEAKLRTFITPGQALVVSAKIMHEGSGFALTEAKIELDGKTVCDADITFRVVDFPQGEFVTNMREVAKRIALPTEVAPHG
jgi:3-hydroxyacyl-[acyl-carrier-protein] dehydratase